MFLNFIADFEDLKEHYNLLNSTNFDHDHDAKSRPSCTVIIKFLEEERDILIGHNTWHEYRAMSYRILKNYNFNYHILPGSSTLVPGHTIAMSSYAGNFLFL